MLSQFALEGFFLSQNKDQSAFTAIYHDFNDSANKETRTQKALP